MKVLIIETGGMGDFISTLPALRYLAKSLKPVEITLGIPHWYLPFVECLELTENFIVFENAKSIRKILSVVKKLRETKYDMAINLHPARKNTLLTLLSRANIKGGYLSLFSSEHYSYQSNIYFVANIFSPKLGKIPAGVNLYERAMLIVKCFSKDNPPANYFPSVTVKDDDISAFKFAQEKFIIVHPFSSKQTKNWPSDQVFQFAELANSRFGFKTVIMGTNRELSVFQNKNNLNGNIFILEPPLNKIISLIGNAIFFVGVDSGLLHLSISMGKNSLGLFGRTAPSLAFPELGASKLISIYKNHNCKCSYNLCVEDNYCMKMITAEEVAGKLSELSKFNH